MQQPHRPRRPSLSLRHWTAALGGAAALLASAASAFAAGPVNGLIVQLRDAPSHVALAREQAAARGGASAVAAQREGARWQRVLGDTALQREMPSTARRHPVGASAQLLRFDRPLAAAEADRLAAKLAARPDVAWVVPNTRERRLQVPGDPYFGGFNQQWWLQLAAGVNSAPIEQRLRGAPDFQRAWASGIPGATGAPAAVIAVLDSGITPHPELAGHLLPGYDFVSNPAYANDGNGRDADPSDPGDWVSAQDRASDPGHFNGCDIETSSWHGTIIAGIAAALTNNGAGVAAINWNGRVLPVRVAGKCGAEVADIVEGMRWAAGLAACRRDDGAGSCLEFVPTNPNPARIVNISFGGSEACGPLYQQAIDELRAAPGGGAVVVAAAGNRWSATPSRPASCQRAVGVVALNRDGYKSNYSSFGSAIAIATVGGDDHDPDSAWASQADSGLLTITTLGATSPAAGDFGYAYASEYGTSFATPVVAGAISLMLSVNPALTADQIVAGLRLSARPHVTSPVPGFNVCSNANPGRCLCTTGTCGAGILDADQALRYAANPSAYVAPSRAPESIDTPALRALAAIGPDRPANATTPVPPPTSGGGGAMDVGWLLGLALAALALRRRAR